MNGKELYMAKYKVCRFNWKHVTFLLSVTLQIFILIFCSIDMDNQDRGLLVQHSEALLPEGVFKPASTWHSTLFAMPD